MPWSVKIGPTVWPVCIDRETKQDSQKSHKSVYFTYLGRSPRWTDFNQNLHCVWCLRRNHVWQVSCLNSHGLRFHRGVEFPIFLLIFAWALQQCSAIALPVINQLACNVVRCADFVFLIIVNYDTYLNFLIQTFGLWLKFMISDLICDSAVRSELHLWLHSLVTPRQQVCQLYCHAVHVSPTNLQFLQCNRLAFVPAHAINLRRYIELIINVLKMFYPT